MNELNLIKNIEGWCSDDKISKMSDLILATKPKTIVEIGVFYGKSLICQSLALKKNGDGKIYGIDPWNVVESIKYMSEQDTIKWWSELNYENIYQKCLCNVIDFQVEDYVEIIKNSAVNAIDKIDFDIDILHIDGNHEEKSSYKDVALYVPKMKRGGFLWFNDANWSQCKKSISLIENTYNCQLIDKALSDDPNNYCNLYVKL